MPARRRSMRVRYRCEASEGSPRLMASSSSDSLSVRRGARLTSKSWIESPFLRTMSTPARIRSEGERPFAAATSSNFSFCSSVSSTCRVTMAALFSWSKSTIIVPNYGLPSAPASPRTSLDEELNPSFGHPRVERFVVWLAFSHRAELALLEHPAQGDGDQLGLDRPAQPLSIVPIDLRGDDVGAEDVARRPDLRHLPDHASQRGLAADVSLGRRRGRDHGGGNGQLGRRGCSGLEGLQGGGQLLQLGRELSSLLAMEDFLAGVEGLPFAVIR